MSVFAVTDFDVPGGNPDQEVEKKYNFITSARNGNIQNVLGLLGQVDINGCNLRGFSALHAAVFSTNKELIKLLIDNGSNVNLRSRTGCTPLHIAVQENLPNVVQLLLENGAGKALRDETGLTALQIAKENNFKSIIAMLAEESTRKVKLPQLHAAAKRNDHMAAFSLLTDKHRHQNVNETSQVGLTALHTAAQFGSAEVAKLLLINGASVNFCTKSGITPLHVASKWGKDSIAILLMKYNCNINCLTNDLLTPLHCSARSGHVRVLDILIKEGGDLALKTRSGLTPLHMAAQGDHANVAHLLLTSGASINDVTYDMLTPLHVSAHCGSVNVATVLLQSNCLIDPTALNGFTPLHVACRKNRIRIVEILIKYGAKINAFTDSGLTPLHIATFLRHVSIIVFLLENKANPNIKCLTNKEETPLHLAVKANNVEIVRELLLSGADVGIKNREQMNPLHAACKYNNFDVVKLLLKHSLTPHSPSSPPASSPLSSPINERALEDYTSLHYACTYGDETLVSLLLDHGADVGSMTKKGFNSVHLAAKSGNVAILKILLEKSPEYLDSTGKNKLTPLHIASHYNHGNAVQYLVNKGAKLDPPAKNGYSPLHIAVKRDHLEVARFLIDVGADINATSLNGFSPLHLSCLDGLHDMTSLLLKCGAHPNVKNVDGLTPIHVAVQEDWIPIVILLLECDALDIDAQTNDGFTPLHFSTHYGFLSATKLLLDNRATTNIRNKYGNSALHQAVQEGHMHVVEVLLEDKEINLDSSNEQHYNPLMIAKRYGFNNIERILINKGASNADINLIKSDYKKSEPETTNKLFLNEDNVIQETMSSKVQDFLDLDKLMVSDDILLSASLSSDLNSYDAHLTYTSPQTPGGFTDNSETSLSVAETPFLLMTPCSGGLLDSPFASPYYSPSFARISEDNGKLIKPPDGASLDEKDELNDVVNVNLITRSSKKGNQTDRRRETWLGVLEKQDDGDGDDDAGDKTCDSYVVPVASQFIRNSGGQDGRIVRRNLQGKITKRNSRERRSYNLAVGSVNYFDDENSCRSLEDTKNEQDKSNISISANQLPYKGFLTSFLVDARGSVAVSGRHSGARFIIPPNGVSKPSRIMCKLIRSHKLPCPFSLSEGEGHVTRILKLSTDVSQFERPIVIEIPHFGVLTGHDRELCVLKTYDGKNWSEHQEDDKLDNFMNNLYDLEPAEKIFDSTIHRIVTKNIPSYLALISRIKKDSKNITSEGGLLTSSVCPQVRVSFPPGAVTKTTNVGLQVFNINKEVTDELYQGMPNVATNKFTCSPVVSIEPRCRKFHELVTVSIPLPSKISEHQSATTINNKTPSLRLFYNLGNAESSNWLDITDSTDMNVSSDTVSFNTGVSARFWLVDAENKEDCLKKLPSLFRFCFHNPVRARFAVYGKRRSQQPDQVKMRVLCLTESNDKQTLEDLQGFSEFTRGPLVELTEGDPVSVSLSDNLEIITEDDLSNGTVATIINQQTSPTKIINPSITCHANYNTMLPLLVKTNTQKFPIDGCVKFSFGSLRKKILTERGDAELEKINSDFYDNYTLGISIPEKSNGKMVDVFSTQVSKVDSQNYYNRKYKIPDQDELKDKTLKLLDVSEQLGSDWVNLAHVLNFNKNQINDIKFSFGAPHEQALVFLQRWTSRNDGDICLDDLERGLKQIGRFDVVIRGLCVEYDEVAENDLDIMEFVDKENDKDKDDKADIFNEKQKITKVITGDDKTYYYDNDGKTARKELMSGDVDDDSGKESIAAIDIPISNANDVPTNKRKENDFPNDDEIASNLMQLEDELFKDDVLAADKLDNYHGVNDKRITGGDKEGVIVMGNSGIIEEFNPANNSKVVQRLNESDNINGDNDDYEKLTRDALTDKYDYEKLVRSNDDVTSGNDPKTDHDTTSESESSTTECTLFEGNKDEHVQHFVEIDGYVGETKTKSSDKEEEKSSDKEEEDKPVVGIFDNYVSGNIVQDTHDIVLVTIGEADNDRFDFCYETNSVKKENADEISGCDSKYVGALISEEGVGTEYEENDKVSRNDKTSEAAKLLHDEATICDHKKIDNNNLKSLVVNIESIEITDDGLRVIALDTVDEEIVIFPDKSTDDVVIGDNKVASVIVNLGNINDDSTITTGDNDDMVITTDDNDDMVITTDDNDDMVITTDDNDDMVITTSEWMEPEVGKVGTLSAEATVYDPLMSENVIIDKKKSMSDYETLLDDDAKLTLIERTIATSEKEFIEINDRNDIKSTNDISDEVGNDMKTEDSLTISSDSDVDFHDLKTELPNLNAEQINILGVRQLYDPIDRILYGYNNPRVCGNSIFYDSEASPDIIEQCYSFNDDSVVSFMPSFEITEPSIEHHENFMSYLNEQINNNNNNNKTFNIQILESDSELDQRGSPLCYDDPRQYSATSTDLRPTFRAEFGEDNPSSFDFESDGAEVSVGVTSSCEELPDGYVPSRLPTFVTSAERFNYCIDENGNRISLQLGLTENVFESIPGADGNGDADVTRF